MARWVRWFDRGWPRWRQCGVGRGTGVRRFGWGGAGQASGVEVSWTAWARVFQERVAHLMRTGNFTTPRSASRSPSLAPGSSVAAMTSVSSSPSPSSDKSEEHTSELQSLMRISYAVFCLKKKKVKHCTHNDTT